MPLTPQDQQAIVATHNTYRSDPAVTNPNLAWDDTLAAGAQTWANYLASTVHQLQHSSPNDRQGLGENIASGATGTRTAAQLADLWGSQEKPNFKPGIFPDVKIDQSKEVGHYTQVIWKTTTKVGCGIATDSTTGQDYLVCRYSPGGNKEGVGVPTPQPVTLTQLSALDDKNVFGVDAANNVYWYSTDDGNAWNRSSVADNKQLKQVSVASDLTVCGLDSNGAIWQTNLSSSSPWTKLPTGPSAFRFVSAGSANNIWAVGTDYIYYKYNGSTWAKGAPGYGYEVSVASDGTVVGLGTNNGYYRMLVGASDWTGMDAGTVAHLSCGSATNTWAVAQDGTFLNYPGDKRTQAVPGSTGKQVYVASDGTTVWSIGTNNQVSRLVNNAWSPFLM